MASWKLLEIYWAAVGRQMVALEAFLDGSLGGLGGSWAALGASLGRLGPPRRSPGGLRRLRGRAPGGHCGVFLVVRQKKLQKKMKKLKKSPVVLSCLLLCLTGVGH